MDSGDSIEEKKKLLLPRAVPIVYTSVQKFRTQSRAFGLVMWHPKQIFVFNLLHCTTEEDLHRLFSVYGNITKIELMINNFNDDSYNHAYITFQTRNGARHAINSKYRITNEKKLQIAAEKDPHVQNYLPDKYKNDLTPIPSPTRSASSPREEFITPSREELLKIFQSTNAHIVPAVSTNGNFFDNLLANVRNNTIFPASQTDSEDELYRNTISTDSSDDDHYYP